MKTHPQAPFSISQLGNQMQHSSRKSVFIFMASHSFLEGLFNVVDQQFILNLVQEKLLSTSDLLMTVIVPQKTSQTDLALLHEKEMDLQQAVSKMGFDIDFFHIPGRTLKGLLAVIKKIKTSSTNNSNIFFWSKNYFNTFSVVLAKKRFSKLHLHFDMSGLVPEEEFYYSNSPFPYRLIKYLGLKFIERINVNAADTISVVSRRFREYLVSKYQRNPSDISVLPCFYDKNQFYIDEGLRKSFREKHQITAKQKIIMYSGMLQKWQEPDLIFSFLKIIQDQDKTNKFRFMIVTFDQKKAHGYISAYGLKNVILESASGLALNGLYNASDIGIAFRTDDLVSYVSSPVKIPEYLATGNSLVTLEFIGDFGTDLKNKKYVLCKKNGRELLQTKIMEIDNLEKPTLLDLAEIQEQYSTQTNRELIRTIINDHHE